MSYLPYDGGDEYTDPDGAGLDGAGGGGGGGILTGRRTAS